MVEHLRLYLGGRNRVQILGLGISFAALVLLTWFIISISNITHTSATSLLISNSEQDHAILESLLFECGYTPDSFASVATKGTTISMILNDTVMWSKEELLETRNSQGLLADSMIKNSIIHRSLIRADGIYTQDDFAKQEITISELQADYDKKLLSLQKAVEQHLSDEQTGLLNKMASNKDWHVDTSFQVLTLSEEEWLVVRQFCCNEDCTMENMHEYMRKEDCDLMYSIRDNNDYILASARNSANKTSVSTEWDNYWTIH